MASIIKKENIYVCRKYNSKNPRRFLNIEVLLGPCCVRGTAKTPVLPAVKPVIGS